MKFTFNKFLLVIILNIIFLFDISSNFIFLNPPTYIAIFRELIFYLALIAYFPKINIKSHSSYFIFLTLFLISIFYGIIYSYYLFRFLLIVLLCQRIYALHENYLKNLISIIIFTLFIIDFIFRDNLYINQGARFFSANASVVSLAALYLTISRQFYYQIFGYVSGLLTGSISYLIFAFTYIIRTPLMTAILAGLIYISAPFVSNSETYRRISLFVSGFAGLHENYSNSSTLYIRLNQLLDVMNSSEFSYLIGAPLSVTPGESGVESQVMFFWCYGGFLGFLSVLFFLFILISYFPIFRGKYFFYPLIVLLYSLTYRWLESFFSVYCMVLVALELSKAHHSKLE